MNEAISYHGGSSSSTETLKSVLTSYIDDRKECLYKNKKESSYAIKLFSTKFPQFTKDENFKGRILIRFNREHYANDSKIIESWKIFCVGKTKLVVVYYRMLYIKGTIGHSEYMKLDSECRDIVYIEDYNIFLDEDAGVDKIYNCEHGIETDRVLSVKTAYAENFDIPINLLRSSYDFMINDNKIEFLDI